MVNYFWTVIFYCYRIYSSSRKAFFLSLLILCNIAIKQTIDFKSRYKYLQMVTKYTLPGRVYSIRLLHGTLKIINKIKASCSFKTTLNWFLKSIFGKVLRHSSIYDFNRSS